MEPSKNNQQVVEFLARLDFCKNLPTAVLDELAQTMRLQALDEGETLIKQGEVGDSLYILWHGQLRVFISQEGEEIFVGQVVPGGLVGEIALLVNEPRKATVRAARDSIILQLDKTLFDNLVEKYPKAMMDIACFCVKNLVEKVELGLIALTEARKISANQKMSIYW